MIQKKEYGYINNEILYNIFYEFIDSKKLIKLFNSKKKYTFVEIELVTIINYDIFLIVIFFDKKIILEKQYSIYNLCNMYIDSTMLELQLENINNYQKKKYVK